MKKIFLSVFFLLLQYSVSAQNLSMRPGIGVMMSVDGIAANISLAATDYLFAGLQGGTHIRQANSIYNYPIYGNGYYISPYLRALLPLSGQLGPYLQAQYYSFSGTLEEKISAQRTDVHSLAGKEFELIGGVEYFLGNSAGIFLQLRFFRANLDDSSNAFQFGIPALGAEWFF